VIGLKVRYITIIRGMVVADVMKIEWWIWGEVIN